MRLGFALALIVASACTAGSLSADPCPPSPDIAAELDVRIAEAKAAEDQQQGRAASDAMWELWLRAPDAAAQEVLDRGMRRREVFDLLGARGDFTKLIDYCPDYAEGWNQRAFVNYLREDYPAALTDLDRALELQPRHVGAQSGRALTLMQMGRTAQARLQLLEAVENNPWLSEAALLAKGAPLGPVGDDI